MSQRKSNRLRLAITIFMSYLLSVFLLLFITGMVLLQTAFSPSYITELIDETGFSEEMYLEIREIFISYASASGIPHDVMLEGLSYRQVDNAVKASVYAAFSVGMAYDFARHENELFELFRSYAHGQGLAPTAELDEGLRDLAELSMEAFVERTDLGIVSLIAEITSRYRNVLTITIAVTAVLSVLTAALLSFINKRVTRWLDAYIYALGAVALFCVAIPLAVLGSGWTQRLNITPLPFNRLISAWLEGIAGGFTMALIPVLSLIVVCVIIRIIRGYRRRARI